MRVLKLYINSILAVINLNYYINSILAVKIYLFTTNIFCFHNNLYLKLIS